MLRYCLYPACGYNEYGENCEGDCSKKCGGDCYNRITGECKEPDDGIGSLLLILVPVVIGTILSSCWIFYQKQMSLPAEESKDNPTDASLLSSSVIKDILSPWKSLEIPQEEEGEAAVGGRPSSRVSDISVLSESTV
ncbi:hypothetical protein Btru_063915 [Bulinus truncatus]|nr:hypothetical protein Btru_063915 [Bulinus truncatus]